MSLTILHLCSNFLLRYLPNFISVWQYSSKWKCLTSSIMAKPSNISSLQSSKGSLNASLVILKLMALWHKWHYVGFKSSTNFFSAFNDFVHTSGICHKSLKILEWDGKYTARAICIVSIVSYFVMLVIFIFKMQRVVDTNMVIMSSYSEKKNIHVIEQIDIPILQILALLGRRLDSAQTRLDLIWLDSTWLNSHRRILLIIFEEALWCE